MQGSAVLHQGGPDPLADHCTAPLALVVPHDGRKRRRRFSLGAEDVDAAAMSNNTMRLDCFPNAAVCGDDVVETAEDCDDGNTQGCDGCSPTCRAEGCGNGRIDCAEQCDAGVAFPASDLGLHGRVHRIPACSSHSRRRRTAARLRARMGDRAFGEHRRTRLARRAEEQAGLCRRRPPLRFRSDARPLPPPRLPVPRRRGSSARLRGRRGRGRGYPAAEGVRSEPAARGASRRPRGALLPRGLRRNMRDACRRRPARRPETDGDHGAGQSDLGEAGPGQPQTALPAVTTSRHVTCGRNPPVQARLVRQRVAARCALSRAQPL